MISLAHAFNYAGSESILTSLWEIDEESSSNIIEHFTNTFRKDCQKDEALRRAKLDYIATAKGRTASPQYWAGLVLMGDAAPLQLESLPTSPIGFLALFTPSPNCLLYLSEGTKLVFVQNR